MVKKIDDLIDDLNEVNGWLLEKNSIFIKVCESIDDLIDSLKDEDPIIENLERIKKLLIKL